MANFKRIQQEAQKYGLKIEKSEKQKHYKVNFKGSKYEIYFNGSLPELQSKIVDPKNLIAEYNVANKRKYKSKNKTQNEVKQKSPVAKSNKGEQKNKTNQKSLAVKSNKKKQSPQQIKEEVVGKTNFKTIQQEANQKYGFRIEKSNKQKHYKVNFEDSQYEIYFNGSLPDLRSKIVDPKNLIAEYNVAKKGKQKNKAEVQNEKDQEALVVKSKEKKQKNKTQNEKNQEALAVKSKEKKQKNQPSQQVRQLTNSYTKRFIVFFENGVKLKLTREGDFPSTFSVAQAQEKFSDRGTVVDVKPVESFE